MFTGKKKSAKESLPQANEERTKAVHEQILECREYLVKGLDKLLSVIKLSLPPQPDFDPDTLRSDLNELVGRVSRLETQLQLQEGTGRLSSLDRLEEDLKKSRAEINTVKQFAGLATSQSHDSERNPADLVSAGTSGLSTMSDAMQQRKDFAENLRSFANVLSARVGHRIRDVVRPELRLRYGSLDDLDSLDALFEACVSTAALRSILVSSPASRLNDFRSRLRRLLRTDVEQSQGDTDDAQDLARYAANYYRLKQAVKNNVTDGELIIPQRGDPYDPNRMEVKNPGLDGDHVGLITAPGYVAGNIVRAKAVVWVVREADDLSQGPGGNRL
jgi:hypothetical protein